MTHRGGAEDAEEKFIARKYSDLCELCASAVKKNANIASRRARNARGTPELCEIQNVQLPLLHPPPRRGGGTEEGA
jgi:hypothetical protein